MGDNGGVCKRPKLKEKLVTDFTSPFNPFSEQALQYKGSLFSRGDIA
jgi:hypothetical protein